MAHDFNCQLFILVDAMADVLHAALVAHIYERNVVVVLNNKYLENLKVLAEMYERLYATEPEVTFVIPG